MMKKTTNILILILGVFLMVDILNFLKRARAGENPGVRPSCLAGSWYQAEPEKLGATIDSYLKRTGTREPDLPPVRAILVPHAGYRYSAQAAAYGFACVKDQPYDRVFLLGLSHRVPLHGAALTRATAFRTPLGDVPVDSELCAELAKNPLFPINEEAHGREHSLEIQLPFLQRVLKPGFKLVPIAFGELEKNEYPRVAEALRKVATGSCLFVVSSDFTHFGERFGFKPFSRDLPRGIDSLDRGAFEPAVAKNFEAYHAHLEKTGATVCGRVAIGVLLHLLGAEDEGRLLRYYRSAELTGEWDGSVSYVAAAWFDNSRKRTLPTRLFANSEAERVERDQLTLEEQKELLKIARETLETHVKSKKTPDLVLLEKRVGANLKKNYGLFCTLKTRGQLRGCIGIVEGVEPLFKAVVRSAVNSASHDPRFDPVTESELASIDIEVTVLTPLRPVAGPSDIIIGWDGMVLEKGGRAALFLPQVAMEQGWELEETLEHLARKAGLRASEWKEGATYKIFQGQVISEEIF